MVKVIGLFMMNQAKQNSLFRCATLEKVLKGWYLYRHQ